MKLTDDHITEILTEMFSRVGLEYDPEFTKQESWYALKTWSADTQVSFAQWLSRYIRKTFNVSKKLAEREANWFVFYCGWKLEDY